MESLCLYVEAPFCAFRPQTSRDYQDTYPFPPPSTVYSMLLSLVGVDWQQKSHHMGVRLALGLDGEPERTRVFRKFRRVPQNSKNVDPLANRRPDYQELLVDVRLWVWLEQGKERPPQDSLLKLVRKALTPSDRHMISRFGGLALGESTNLVNQVVLNPSLAQIEKLSFLVRDSKGYYSLPVWVDHPRTGRDGAVKKRFAIRQMNFEIPSQEDPRWITISPESE